MQQKSPSRFSLNLVRILVQISGPFLLPAHISPKFDFKKIFEIAIDK